jgi:hypothetical protein
MATGRVTGTGTQGMTTVTVTGMDTTITTPGHLTKRCRKST